ANVNPVVTATATSGNEGSPVTETASFTDAGTADTHTCSINWGDGNTTSGRVSETNGSGTCSGSHTYNDNGLYTVTVTVTARDVRAFPTRHSSALANVNPVVTATATSGNEGSPVTETASFTDAGTADTHTCSINWGDGNTTAGSVSETNGSGTCSGSHTYNDNGSCTATATATDDSWGHRSSGHTSSITTVELLVSA